MRRIWYSFYNNFFVKGNQNSYLKSWMD